MEGGWGEETGRGAAAILRRSVWEGFPLAMLSSEALPGSGFPLI